MHTDRAAVCVSPCHPQAMTGRASLSPSSKWQLPIPRLSSFLFCQQNHRQQNAQQQKLPCAKDTGKCSPLPPFPGPDCTFTAPELQAEVSPNRTCSSNFYFIMCKFTSPHRCICATSTTVHSSISEAISEKRRTENNRR